MPVNLYDNFLTFRDSDQKFILEGELLKKMTIENFNVDLAKVPVKKLKFKFRKEMYFDGKVLGKESTRDKSPIKLLQSPAFIASGTSTMFLPENTKKLCDRLILLLQEKQAGINSKIIKEKIDAITDNC